MAKEELTNTNIFVLSRENEVHTLVLVYFPSVNFAVSETKCSNFEAWKMQIYFVYMVLENLDDGRYF